MCLIFMSYLCFFTKIRLKEDTWFVLNKIALLVETVIGALDGMSLSFSRRDLSHIHKDIFSIYLMNIK